MKPRTSSCFTGWAESISAAGNLKTRLLHRWRLDGAALGLGALALCWATTATAQINWISADVGNPTFKGTVTSTNGGGYIIQGGGNDIWNNASEFHYYYAWASGTTWDAIVHIRSFSGPDNWSKVELLVDQADPTVGPQGGDPFIACMGTQPSSVTAPDNSGTGVNQFGVDQFRTQLNGPADWKQVGISPAPNYPNAWMKIHRDGNVFQVWYSYDNVNWTNYINIDTTSSSLVGQDNGTTFGTAWPDVVAVGVAVTAHNDGWTDPNTGAHAGATAVIDNLSATFPAVQAPTVLNPVVQVQDDSTHAGSEATFSFSTTNNAVPNVVLPTYQWFKNGTAIPGATGTSLTFLAVPTDDGAKVYCTATVPAPYNTTVSSLNSATGTLSVASATIYTNGLKTEFFSNVPGTGRQDVEAGNIGPASRIYRVSNWDDHGGLGNNYVTRVSGYFIPPASANYTFFVCSDDQSDLFLSTDSTPANKRLIAQETAYSNPDQWVDVDINGVAGSGGSVWSQKCSSYFTNSDGSVPYAAGIPLVAGQLYYIEGVHYQAGGGDNFGVTYTTNDIQTITNGSLSMLQVTNHNIAYLSYPDTAPTWTLQPTNTAVPEGTSVNFYSLATDIGEFAPTYQWYFGGSPVAGATSTSLNIAYVSSSENGLTAYCVATSPNSGLSSTSAVVTLTVGAPLVERGLTRVDYWYSFDNLASIEPPNTPPAPEHSITSPRFEATTANNSAGVNYDSRLTTWFYPPTTGEYVFFLCSDDQSDLYVSTDDNPANKRLVAQESAWSNPYQWTTSSGSSTLSQKRSDQWSPDGGVTMPYATGIQLTAGQPYYIELDHHDTGGGNNAEATFKLVSDPDPANGSVSALSGNLIGIYVPRSQYVAFTQQPTNTTQTLGNFATFSVAGATDSKIAVGTTGDPRPLWDNLLAYQWYLNGTPIPGAIGSSYGFGPVSPSDNGDQFSVQIRSIGYVNNSGSDIWSNSATATLTVAGTSVYEPGYALHQYFNLDPPIGNIESGAAGAPGWSMSSPAFEVDIGGTEVSDNFSDQLVGYFVPPTTGAYVFYCNSDDNGHLWLSTDSSMAHLRMIAQETGWGSGALQWGQSAGTVSQVVSSTFVDPTTGQTPYANGIQLTAGQKYAMKMVHEQGGGGTYSCVTATLLTDPAPTTGTPSTIRGSEVGCYVPACTFVNVTNNPQSLTLNNYQPATFTVGGNTDSQIPVGPETDWRPYIPPTSENNYLIFQWYKNGQPIAGANSSTYKIQEVLPTDNGDTYYCAVRALGYADSNGNLLWATSSVANLTVNTTVPQLAYAAFYTNDNYAPFYVYGSNLLTLGFTTPMDPTLLTNASSYTLSGGVSILGVIVDTNSYKTVALMLSGVPTLPINVTVSSSLVGLGGGLPISSTNVTVAVNQAKLTDQDIGFTPVVDPGLPGIMYVTGPNSYTITCEGSDIWNTEDGFNFAYEEKTGNFDVVVRQLNNTHTSNWAKGGLMVREDLTPGSRNWNIVNDPLSSDGIMAPDGSGYGANAVECNARITPDGSSAAWDSGARPVPAYPNAWVRITRTNNVLTAYYSTNGVTWIARATNDTTQAGSSNALPATVYVGLCTTAHNNDVFGVLPYLYQNTVDYADYNSNYVLSAPSVTTLKYAIANGNIIITWSPIVGQLQSSPALSGPNENWQNVSGGTGGSVTVPVSGTAMFFRVVGP